MPYEYTCKNCGKKFTNKNKDTKYCSKGCYAKAMNKGLYHPAGIPCDLCSKPIKKNSSRSTSKHPACCPEHAYLLKSMDFAMQKIGDEAARVPELPDPPRLTLNDCIVASDMHSPRHHEKTLENIMRIALLTGIKTLVWVGDIFDFQWAARFFWLSVQRKVAPLESMIGGCNLLLALLECFENIYGTLGNHDLWAAKKFSRELKNPRILEAFLGVKDKDEAQELAENPVKLMLRSIESIIDNKRVKIFQDTSLIIRSPKSPLYSKDLLCVHPASYTKYSPNAERDIAAAEHMNVAGTHGHQESHGWDISGKFWVGQIGHCSDVKKISYLRYKKTRHPKQNNGFLMIKNGHYHPMTDYIDWDMWKALARAEKQHTL